MKRSVDTCALVTFLIAVPALAQTGLIRGVQTKDSFFKRRRRRTDGPVKF
jgi:hypothetical protein